MRFSIAAGAIGVLFSLGIAACGSPAATVRERPVVVATTTQVGSVAEELGGEAIDLTVLLAPGVEAHDFELTPDRAAALERGDLILLSGAGLEDWLQDTLEATGSEGRSRDLSAGIELRAPESEDEDDGHAHGDDEHEDAVGVDPHYWLSGPNQVRMVENARDALVDLAPDAADGIEARAAELIGRIQAADAEVRRLMAEIPPERRTVVTDHDALGYFIDEYGLTFGGSIFPSLDVSSEPSARQIEALMAEVRELGVTAIFTESAVDPALARAIAEEAGARVVDEPLYTDSLGPEGSGAETLDGMLVHNARVIHAGLTGD